jgi:hypothetical protein
MRIARFSIGNEPMFGIIDGETSGEETTAITGDPRLCGSLVRGLCR